MKTHKQINPFFVYISTSFLFGLIVVYLALGPSDKWHNFLNSKPLRGEMGFGRFVIRGARIINGNQ
jgi:hypothetical protein